MTPPIVLIFSGSDPSGGAGMQADITAVAAIGAHPMSVVTALTVQDHQSVFAVHPVNSGVVRHQAQVLIDRFPIASVKLGIPGNRANAQVIAELICTLRIQQPDLPVVFDPVLSNTQGDRLSRDDPAAAIASLFALATVITPNRPEADYLCTPESAPEQQARQLLARGCQYVLLKGGHTASSSACQAEATNIVNHLYSLAQHDSWAWPRLSGTFHGSGCTLAAALSAYLARGLSMKAACDAAQRYCQQTLTKAYALAPGQKIPNRLISF